MPVTIELRFPWGRVHATPWERSANEAEPEWPPSTWRLLRALYSVWRFRCPQLDSAVVERVLSALAAAPTYRLPPHQVAHTRHYFPDPSHRSGESGATDKVLDAFVVIPPDEPVLVHWAEANLDDEARMALAMLLAELPFLGRGESLCDAALGTGPYGREGWIGPLADGETLDDRREVGVLVPEAPLDVPRLLATTKQVRALGFADPPGSRRVRYGQPVEARVGAKPRRRSGPRPTIAVLAVSGSVLPQVTASLGMCELLRMAVQDKFGDIPRRSSSSTLSGKADGAKRLDQHAHAHYLALPRGNPEGRLIDRFVIWAPEGLQEDEVRAVTALRELNPGRRAQVDGGKDLRRVHVRLEALGGPQLLAGELTGPETRWRSLTPFITSRNINDATKRRLKDDDDPWLSFLTQEVRREASLRGLGPVEVRLRLAAPGRSWLSFRRHRAFKPEKLALSPRGAGFDLIFAEPVQGPIALGAQCHFGLGLFVPDLSIT